MSLNASAIVPGKGCRRLCSSAKNAICWGVCGYLYAASEIVSVSTLSVSMPVGARCRFHRLRRSNPAQVSKTRETAICAATSV